MARPTTRSTPSKRKASSASTPKSSSTPTPGTPTPASAGSAVDRPFPPGVGPGARPSLAANAPPPKPLSYHLISGSLVLGTLAAASLALYSIRQLLRPLFGQAGAAQYSQVLLIALCAPSVMVPLLEPHLVLSILGSVVAVAPVVVYHLGRLVARVESVQELGPGVGAVIAQLPVVLPLAVCTVNLMKRWMPDRDYQLNGSIRAGFTTYAGLHSLGPIYTAVLPRSSDLFSPCNILSLVAAGLAFMALVAPDEDPHSLAAAAAAGAGADADGANAAAGTGQTGRAGDKQKKQANSAVKMILLALPIGLMSLPRLSFTNPLGPGQIRMSNCAPITPSPSTTASTFGEGEVKVLARGESVCGTLVVGETSVRGRGMRYLRCDDALLGGQWLESEGGQGRDSIFAAFDLQQAVLLADRPKSNEEKALVIGLGIGTLPSSLHSHGLTPTILESDPLIPTYARQFFSFPPSLGVTITEGRQWIYTRTQQRLNGTLSPSDSGFAYVVHDVFSGGALPAHMYSVEVFQELRELMAADGVIAVNVVGELGGNAGRAVWLTLGKAFEGGACRAFHDSSASSSAAGIPKPAKGELSNIIIFCTPSPSLSFLPVPKDFSKSSTTLEILKTLPERELTAQEMIGNISEHLKEEDWVVREVRNYLEKWTAGDGKRGWQAMRKLLPAEVWDAY